MNDPGQAAVPASLLSRAGRLFEANVARFFVLGLALAAVLLLFWFSFQALRGTPGTQVNRSSVTCSPEELATDKLGLCAASTTSFSQTPARPNPLLFVVSAFLMVLAFGFANAMTVLASAGQEKASLLRAVGKGMRFSLTMLWTIVLAGLTWVGGLVFILPFFYWTAAFFLLPTVVLREGVSGMKALVRARSLVKGNEFAVFFRVFAVGAAFFILTCGGAYAALTVMTNLSSLVAAIASLVLIVTAIALPLVLCFSAALYEDRLRRATATDGGSVKRLAFVAACTLGAAILLLGAAAAYMKANQPRGWSSDYTIRLR